MQFGIRSLFHVQNVLTSNPLDLMAASGRVYSGIPDILVSVGRNVAPEAKTVSCGRRQECYNTYLYTVEVLYVFCTVEVLYVFVQLKCYTYFVQLKCYTYLYS